MKVLQPAGWTAPKGYANGVAAQGLQVYVAGQIGWNAQCAFDSDDLVAQVRQALLNVRAVLAEAVRALAGRQRRVRPGRRVAGRRPGNKRGRDEQVGVRRRQLLDALQGRRGGGGRRGRRGRRRGAAAARERLSPPLLLRRGCPTGRRLKDDPRPLSSCRQQRRRRREPFLRRLSPALRFS